MSRYCSGGPIRTVRVDMLIYCNESKLYVQMYKLFLLGEGRHRGMKANAHIEIGSNSYEKVETFKYLASLLTNENYIQEEIKCRLKVRNSYYYSVQTLLSSRLLSRNLKIKMIILYIIVINIIIIIIIIINHVIIKQYFKCRKF